MARTSSGSPTVEPPALSVRALDAATWDDFAALVERNNGVWGGCWCMGFHPEGLHRSPPRHRADKEARVRSEGAHAALVYDGDTCVGWCQFGAPDELPRIKHRRAYEKGSVPDRSGSTAAAESGDPGGGPRPPDWRITCFFVDKKSRHRGVSATALTGVLRLIAELGGGTVESFPEDVEGRKVSSSFLHNGTLALFESSGFEPVRQLGKNHWLVRTSVRASRS